MSECIDQTRSYEDIDKEVSFELAERQNVRVTIKYSKEDTISLLMREINGLKEQIKKIEQKNSLVQEESLIKMWDNEYDEKWNDG